MRKRESVIKSLGAIYLLSTCTIELAISMECDSTVEYYRGQVQSKADNTAREILDQVAAKSLQILKDHKSAEYTYDGLISWTDNFLERILYYIKRDRGEDDSKLLTDLKNGKECERRSLSKYTDSAKCLFETENQLKIDHGNRLELDGVFLDLTDQQKRKFLLGCLTVELLKIYDYGDGALCDEFKDSYSWNLFEAICYAWYAPVDMTLRNAISLSEEIPLLNEMLSCAQKIDAQHDATSTDEMTAYATALKTKYIDSRTDEATMKDCSKRLNALGFVGYDVHKYRVLERSNEAVLDDKMKFWNLYVNSYAGSENLKKFDNVEELKKFLDQNKSISDDFHRFVNPYLNGQHRRQILDDKTSNLMKPLGIEEQLRLEKIADLVKAGKSEAEAKSLVASMVYKDGELIADTQNGENNAKIKDYTVERKSRGIKFLFTEADAAVFDGIEMGARYDYAVKHGRKVLDK